MKSHSFIGVCLDIWEKERERETFKDDDSKFIIHTTVFIVSYSYIYTYLYELIRKQKTKKDVPLRLKFKKKIYLSILYNLFVFNTFYFHSYIYSLF